MRMGGVYTFLMEREKARTRLFNRQRTRFLSVLQRVREDQVVVCCFPFALNNNTRTPSIFSDMKKGIACVRVERRNSPASAWRSMVQL